MSVNDRPRFLIKQSACFQFDKGGLSINREGFGESTLFGDGAGTLAFGEDDLETEWDYENPMPSRFVHISKDDLLELRDFLVEELGPPRGAWGRLFDRLLSNIATGAGIVVGLLIAVNLAHWLGVLQ